MNIIDLIPCGKENAISRNSLVIKTGLSDRKIRDLIALERRNHVILNVQDGKGYYRPTEKEMPDIERFVKQETRRAKSIFWSLRAAKKAIKGVI
jgi:hypothetical protein